MATDWITVLMRRRGISLCSMSCCRTMVRTSMVYMDFSWKHRPVALMMVFQSYLEGSIL